MPKTCCGTSVGVIITDEHDRLLMVTRGWWPKGTAPVAGHVRDAHTNVATATADGKVAPAEGETKGAAWYDRDQVHALATATLEHYRAGGTAADQPDHSLETVWLRLLFEAGLLPWLTAADLALAEAAYTTAPPAYWLGGRR